MRSITSVPCECPRCCWDGTVGDAETNDEGDPVCPECFTIVVIEYTDEELQVRRSGDA